MAAGTYNLELEQGVTETRDLAIKDASNVAIDISAWTFRAQIRSSYTSDDILASGSFSITNGAGGLVTMTFSDTDTAAIPYRAGRTYVWDLEAVKGDGTIVRLMMGSVEISPEVTR